MDLREFVVLPKGLPNLDNGRIGHIEPGKAVEPVDNHYRALPLQLGDELSPGSGVLP